MVREIKIPKYKYSEYEANVFQKLQNGTYQERQFIKVYDSLFNINGFTMTTVMVYSIIRNQVYITNLHQNSSDNHLVGMSTFVTNEIFENYGLSIRSVYRSLDTLKEYGFIDTNTGTNRKNGRVITLLRDVKEYQPEEIELYQDKENKKDKVKKKINTSNIKSTKKDKFQKDKVEQNKNIKQDKQNDDSLGEDLDDFEF